MAEAKPSLGSTRRLLQLAFDAIGRRTHTGLEITPIVAHNVPIDHGRLAAGRARWETIARASRRRIVLVHAQNGHGHSENKTEQDRHGAAPLQAKCAAWNAPPPRSFHRVRAARAGLPQS